MKANTHNIPQIIINFENLSTIDALWILGRRRELGFVRDISRAEVKTKVTNIELVLLCYLYLKPSKRYGTCGHFMGIDTRDAGNEKVCFFEIE